MKAFVDQVYSQPVRERFKYVVQHAEQCPALGDNASWQEKAVYAQSLVGRAESSGIVELAQDFYANEHDASLRNILLGMIAKRCTVRWLFPTLASLPESQLPKLLKALQKCGRICVIEQWYISTRRNIQIRFIHLLHESQLMKHAPNLLDDRLSDVWIRLAKHRINCFVKLAAGRLAYFETHPNDVVSSSFHYTLSKCFIFSLHPHPIQTLELCRRATNLFGYRQFAAVFGWLFRKLPGPTARVLINLEDKLGSNRPLLVFTAKTRITLDHDILWGQDWLHLLSELIRMRLFPLSDWFRIITSFYRGDLYEKCADDSWLLDFKILAALPTAEMRAREARRALSLSVVKDQLILQAELSTLLPEIEADPILKQLSQCAPAMRVTNRIAAVTAQIARGAYEDTRKALSVAIQYNADQAPVRAGVLVAISKLPLRRLLACTDQIVVLFSANLDAADSSAQIWMLMHCLLWRLFSVWYSDPNLLKQYVDLSVRVGERSGTLYDNYVASQTFSDKPIPEILQMLVPAMQQWRNQGREPEWALLSAFGRRFWIPELSAFLTQIICDDSEASQEEIRGAVRALRKGDHLALRSIVPDLVRKDPSWLTISPIIVEIIAEMDPSLLLPVVCQSFPEGRFPSREIFLPSPGRHLSVEQDSQYASALARVLEDSGGPFSSRDHSITLLGELKSVQADAALIACAQSRNVLLRGKAIRELAMRPGGVAVVVGFLNDDDRAKAAIYALQKSVHRFLNAEEAITHLKLAFETSKKITVQKEAIRLLASYSDGLEYLLTLLTRKDLHVDVKCALVATLLEFLSTSVSPKLWPFFQECAVDPSPAVASSVVSLPYARLTKIDQEIALRCIFLPIISHPVAQVRNAGLAKLALLQPTDKDEIFAEPLKNLILAQDESQIRTEQSLAIRALIQLYAEKELIICASLRACLSRRPLLRAFCSVLAQSVSRPRTAHLLEPVVAVLQEDRMLQSTVLELCFCAKRTGVLILLLPHFELNADLLMQLDASLHNMREEGAALYQLEEHLRDYPEPMGRRMGLSVLIFLAQSTIVGWTDRNREALEHYRKDATAAVASKAQFTFPQEKPHDWGRPQRSRR